MQQCEVVRRMNGLRSVKLSALWLPAKSDDANDKFYRCRTPPFTFANLQAISRKTPVDEPRNVQRIRVLERIGKQRVGVVLEADGPQEAVDGQGADRGAAAIGSGRIRATVHH